MSVSLGIYHGKMFDCRESACIGDMPVSFQSVWNRVWRIALKECGVRKFLDCYDFGVDDIPAVIGELNAVYSWVNDSGDADIEYIQERILQIKDYLDQFYTGFRSEEFWFSLG